MMPAGPSSQTPSQNAGCGTMAASRIIVPYEARLAKPGFAAIICRGRRPRRPVPRSDHGSGIRDQGERRGKGEGRRRKRTEKRRRGAQCAPVHASNLQKVYSYAPILRRGGTPSCLNCIRISLRQIVRLRRTGCRRRQPLQRDKPEFWLSVLISKIQDIG